MLDHVGHHGGHKAGLCVGDKTQTCICTAAAPQTARLESQRRRSCRTFSEAAAGSFDNIRSHHQLPAARGTGETTQDSNV